MTEPHGRQQNAAQARRAGPRRRVPSTRPTVRGAAVGLAAALGLAGVALAQAVAPSQVQGQVQSSGGGALAAAPALRVALSGRMGPRALLVIEGRARTVAVGETVDGVRLIGWRDESAEVEIGGQRRLLRVGGAPVDLTRGPTGGADGEGAGRIVLLADAGGHYLASGSINGRSTRFMVDTGATLVSMSQMEADRLGIAFRDAPRGMAQTANGEVPVHRVTLQALRVGTVELPAIEAVVLPAAMPHVLLGNNFLERFNLQREDGRMTLQRRP